MALTSYSDIKAQVLDELDRITESRYPEDILNEMADSEVPVYYSGIIAEWTELPMDECDRWQEFFGDNSQNITITHLMSVDLLLHYQDQFRQAFNELSKDIEETTVDLDIDHAGHFTTFGTYFCDTCNSPYCQKA